MKIVFSTILILMLATSTATSAIKWYTMQEALDLQKKKPKKIFVDVYTKWCGWCVKMDKNTFSDPVVARYMSDNFYCVKLDAESSDTIVYMGQKYYNPKPGVSRSYHQFASLLLKGRMNFPSYVFIDEASKGITTVSGYRTPDQFLPWLRYVAKNKYKTKTFDQYYQEEEEI